MRPPDLPGGNSRRLPHSSHFTSSTSFNEAAGFTRRKPLKFSPTADQRNFASMRPPDLPGGNTGRGSGRRSPRSRRFNEAAGFTRRKRSRDSSVNSIPR